MHPSDAEIATRLHAILQSDEFQPSLSEGIWVWLDKARHVLMHWLENLSPGMRVMVAILCICVLAVIAFHLWRTYEGASARVRVPTGTRGKRQRPISSPALLVDRARSLADTGLLRDAARTLQQALLLQTCLERDIPWQASLSDWEWLSILRPSEGVVNFTRNAQRLAFGPEPTRAAFDECAREADALVVQRHQAGSEAP
jgi:hypothetical protein